MVDAAQRVTAIIVNKLNAVVIRSLWKKRGIFSIQTLVYAVFS